MPIRQESCRVPPPVTGGGTAKASGGFGEHLLVSISDDGLDWTDVGMVEECLESPPDDGLPTDHLVLFRSLSACAQAGAACHNHRRHRHVTAVATSYLPARKALDACSIGLSCQGIRQLSGLLKLMGIRIGPIETRNRVFLAPMSGVTDEPFRSVAHHCGAGLSSPKWWQARNW